MSDPKDNDGTSPPDGDDPSSDDAADESAAASPTKPDDPETVRRKALSARMHALHAVIRAQAHDIVRAYIVAEIADAKLGSDEIESFVDALREELTGEGTSDEDIESATNEAREGLTKLGQGGEEEIEAVCEMALDDAAPLILTAWVNTLGMSASRHSGAAWLRLSLLGDDMLPVGDSEADDYFAEQFMGSPVLPNVAKDVLRNVRASLPAGKLIPDDAVAVLELAWNIVVIP